MKFSTTVAALAAAGSILATPSPVQKVAARADSATVPTVTVKGNAFFTGNDRFYIRGVDYQPGGSSKLVDPIADGKTCLRDIEQFKSLGINTVRIYSVDNLANHDECMNALAQAGIYLILDVNLPLYSINRADPHASYNAVYLRQLFATIDAFAGYTNTLAFISGNEVINDGETTNCAPYVKAVTRDMRQYIGSRGYRQIPVGYSAADVNTNRLEMAQYMNCGSDDARSDFFAFNDYSWCAPSDFHQSGWDEKVKNFTGYGLPLFLSEYGCTTNKRDWGEVASLYSTDMTAVYSGGLVYEYSQEENGFGLAKIDSDTQVTTNSDFESLTQAFEKTKNPSGDGGYNKTGGASGCPAKSDNWQVDTDALPAIPDDAAKYMKDGPGQGFGIDGSGSQNAEGTSTGDASPGSGSVTATSSPGGKKKSDGASLQSFEHAYVTVGLVVALSSFFGATLL